MKILVVRQLGGVGDCLMLTPVFRGLREKYPKATIQLITGDQYQSGALMDVFTHVPKKFLDDIFGIEAMEAIPQRTREVWTKYYSNVPPLENELIWQRADMRFDLNIACVDYEWAALHSPEGITKPRYQVWCEAAGVTPSSYKPIYEILPEERTKALAWFADHNVDASKAVGLGVTAHDNKRALGPTRLEEICDGLRASGLTPIVIDPTYHFPHHLALNGKRISELMPLIEQMAAVVTVDSGLLHMAGTVGTPVIGIFGPTDYKMRMGQYLGSAIDSRKLMPCAPCWYSYPCIQRGSKIAPFSCLSKISANIVIEETLRWVQRGKTPGDLNL